LNPKAEKKFWKNISVLQETAQACIEQRRANPGGKKDLLEAMLNGKDPATGQKLPDHTVMNNVSQALLRRMSSSITS
jgi:cytochrome P450/NADPH-cytochrome P450 reductase